MEISGNKKGNIKVFLICALLGIVLYAGAYFLRHLLFWLMCALPLPYIIIRLKCGKLPAVCMLLLTAAFACAVSGITNGVILFVPSAAAALICGAVLAKRLSPYYTLLYCCSAAFLSLALFLILLYAMRGLTLQGLTVGLIKAEFSATPDITLKIFYKYLSAAQGAKQLTPEMLSPIALSQIPAETAKAGLMRIIEPIILLGIPEMSSVGVCLSGLMYMVVPGAALKKSEIKLTRLPAFSEWQLSDNVAYWAMGLYIGALILGVLGLNNFDIVFAVVSGAFSTAFTIQGMALFDWLLKKKIDVKFARGAIIAVVWLVTSGISLFVWAGLIEQFAKFRQQRF